MNINHKVKRIVFFDTTYDVDTYLRRPKQDDTLFVAMKPTVYSYLRQKGAFAQNTLSYFTTDSHKKALEKSRTIVDWLRSALDLDEVYKDSFIYWARLSIHYCLWAIEVVSKAVDIHHPEIISARFSGRGFVHSLCIEPQENYLGLIVNAIAQHRNLEFEDIPRGAKGVSYLNISRWLVHAPSCVRFILRDRKFRLWEKMISIRNMFHKKRPIFFTTGLYGMKDLAMQLKGQNRLIYFLNAPVISPFGLPDFIVRLFPNKRAEFIMSQKKKFLALESAIRGRRNLFSSQGVIFADVIAQKVKDSIADNILGLMLWADKLKGFIHKSQPLAFVSNGTRADDAILAKLCRQNGIQDILISHGSHVFPKDENESIEWGEHGRALLNAPFSHLALQSPLAEGYLKRFTSRGKVVKTGPLIWGNSVNRENSRMLFEKMLDGKYSFGKVKIILHAGTPKLTNSLRFYVYETPDEYIQALCELSNAIEKIPDVILVIKFRPKAEISVNALKTVIPFSEKVILSVNESFLGILGMADLLVSFSSTAIEEALQNRIPELLYGGGGRYQHIPAYEIKPAGAVERAGVYCIKEARHLERGIAKILDLNLDGSGRDKGLFDQYIYGEREREPLEHLL